MRTFKIDEISAVDRPAQAGARAVIMKRAGGRATAGAEAGRRGEERDTDKSLHGEAVVALDGALDHIAGGRFPLRCQRLVGAKRRGPTVGPTEPNG